VQKLSVFLFLLGAIGTASAQQESAADDAYMPLFLMYSGDPSPERLQGLRQFLSANNTPKEVVEDTLDTVIYKLKTFKTGFAYPVYFSETATSGNACVVADSHHADHTQAVTILTSPRLFKYVLGNRAPVVDLPALQDSVLNHEIFHCYDLMKQSQTEVGMQVARDGSAYFSYWSEVGADAFAALKHLRGGGDKKLLRQIRDFRTLNLLNDDAVHYTSAALDDIIWHYDSRRLSALNTRQLLELAYAIREQTALTPAEFGAVDIMAGRFNTQLKMLTGSTPQASGTWLPHASDATPDPQYFSQMIVQLRYALHELGGDISASNGYFYPLVRKYYLPLQVRLYTAELDPK
jgi:hypothetical protein